MVEIYRREDFETPFSNDRAFANNEFQKLEEGDTDSPKALKREPDLLHTGILYYVANCKIFSDKALRKF